MNIKRLLSLPEQQRSVFLWGPRKTGKSWWLREHCGQAPLVDLLQTEVFAEYASRPSLLRERAESEVWRRGGKTLVIDEIQRVPALLDEVHWLIENRGLRFVLTGSSARKLRRGHANLLAGRAWRRELRPFCLAELWAHSLPEGLPAFKLEDCFVSGLLPPHYLSPKPAEDLRAYVADYLREEIAAEAQVRNLPGFAEFLRVAALTSAELLNYVNVAREVGVSAKVVRGYFEILEDTLLGFRVSPWRKSRTRRMILTDKFYMFDVGVMNHLARRAPKAGTPEFGKSFEQLVLQELLAYRAYRAQDLELTFWRTSTGHEVDFIVDDKRLAVEVKASQRVHDVDLAGLTALAEDGAVKKRLLVAAVREPQMLRDRLGNVQVLPLRQFVDSLWADDLVE